MTIKIIPILRASCLTAFVFLGSVSESRSNEDEEISLDSYSEEQIVRQSLIENRQEILTTDHMIVEMEDLNETTSQNYWETLPTEMVQYITSLYDINDLLTVSLLSKKFLFHTRLFIPGFIKLPENPSLREIVTMLNNVEAYEENHISSLTEYGNLKTLYEDELKRLGDYEEYVRYSPSFKARQGSKRIDALLATYKINKPKNSLNLGQRIYSSIIRDPYVLPMMIPLTIGVTTVLALAMSSNLSLYKDSVDYHDNFYNRADGYNATYAKNLAYALSDDFTNKYVNVNGETYHAVKLNFEVTRGVNLYANDADFVCSVGNVLQPNAIVNTTLFCQNANMTELLETLPDPQHGGMFMENVKTLFGTSFSLQELESYFQKIAKFVCKQRINDWFVQNSQTQPTYIATYKCDNKDTCYNPLPSGMTKLHVNRVDYYINCSTTAPLPLSYPAYAVVPSSLGIAICWGLYIFLFWQWIINL